MKEKITLKELIKKEKYKKALSILIEDDYYEVLQQLSCCGISEAIGITANVHEIIRNIRLEYSYKKYEYVDFELSNRTDGNNDKYKTLVKQVFNDFLNQYFKLSGEYSDEYDKSSIVLISLIGNITEVLMIKEVLKERTDCNHITRFNNVNTGNSIDLYSFDRR